MPLPGLGIEVGDNVPSVVDVDGLGVGKARPVSKLPKTRTRCRPPPGIRRTIQGEYYLSLNYR